MSKMIVVTGVTRGIGRAMAQELPRGLAVVSLNPGVIDTEMLRSCWGDGAASCPSPDSWARILPTPAGAGPA